ncbi:hypothetical protein BDW71DRAFT_182696 [Aspergillus fruticulosus]
MASWVTACLQQASNHMFLGMPECRLMQQASPVALLVFGLAPALSNLLATASCQFSAARISSSVSDCPGVHFCSTISSHLCSAAQANAVWPFRSFFLYSCAVVDKQFGCPVMTVRCDQYQRTFQDWVLNVLAVFK